MNQQKLGYQAPGTYIYPQDVDSCLQATVEIVQCFALQAISLVQRAHQCPLSRHPDTDHDQYL